MPQNPAVRRIVRQQIPRRVAGEQQLARRAQQTRKGVAEASARVLVLPRDIAGLVVDRRQNRFGESAAAAPAVPLRLGIGIGEIRDAVPLLGIDVEQPGFRTEARRGPVGGAAAGSIDQRSIHLRFLGGIGNRLALGIDALHPVHADVTLGHQVLSVGPIEHREDAVAGRLRQHLARLPVEEPVEQYRRFHVVPVVRVVRRWLVIPDEFPGVGIQRHNRCGPKIGARPSLSGEDGVRIAGSPVEKIQLGVVRAGHPRHAAAVLHGLRIGPGLRAGLALPRRGVPAPLHFAGLRIAGIQEAGHVHGIAAHARDNVILDHQRAGGAEILHLLVGDLLLPALFSILRIERDQPAIGRHRDTAIRRTFRTRDCPPGARPCPASCSARSPRRCAHRLPRRDRES